jgi:dihydropteroate synthase
MKIREHQVDFTRTHVMGILNVTPDSFSDGGKHSQIEDAVEAALTMVAAGASFIDIGGESTRPGAPAVSIQEELDRVVPVVEALRERSDVWISVDTSKPQVMLESAGAGADLINDIRSFSLPGALDAAVKLGLPVCLMHMQGQPDTMQAQPHYEEVTTEIYDYLLRRAEECIAAGIARDQIMLDPGFGFGKSLAHNYLLLKDLGKFVNSGFPVLAGMSRKSMIGNVIHKPVDERLAGSVALATLAALAGAQVLRVHDVSETVDAVKLVSQLKNA